MKKQSNIPEKYECLLCGRDKFTRRVPHVCKNGQLRKKGLKWKRVLPGKEELIKLYVNALISGGFMHGWLGNRDQDFIDSQVDALLDISEGRIKISEGELISSLRSDYLNLTIRCGWSKEEVGSIIRLFNVTVEDLLWGARITEGNKMIADLMGHDYNDGLSHVDTDEDISSKELKYHKSFDEIMAVLMKITSDPFVDYELKSDGKTTTCIIRSAGEVVYGETMLGNNLIKNIWFAAIGYIKW